ncbi:PAS domain S-box-containing protein/diguanylate cyclase (GGDEF)-like protein [Aminivibrio pyruvatiphilus]|uniref:PAS domain S-box-containing protein/diguanylate cyclase (GGDEF)-like protein n=1 Tax=Aminivibrio pyruvatiphilus TaxID=1005740 RepID=A0A4R8M204_9BACT|nr:EAL domain-containing protein [Aminivibrio pyruvatiphilus]TDY57035.1 PAS domain S-box-containing protein/diguanylate cyclase (GGDEF)-like protein [Aminivibrio pyruvatiphilus]
MAEKPQAAADNMEKVVQSAGERVFFRTFLQTMAPVSLLLVLLFAVIFGVLLPLLEKSHMAEKRNLCKNLILVQLHYLDALHREELAGNIPPGEGQARALARIRSLRFGEEDKDYFWILGPERTLLVHPYRTDLEGVNPDTAAGPDGVLLRQLFDRIEIAVSSPERGGIVDYQWHFKDDLNSIAPKTSYVALFEPWNWIVGTGVYIDDAEKSIAAWKMRFVAAGLLSIAAAGAVSLFLSIRAAILGKKAAQADLLDRSLKEKNSELARSESQLALITQIYRNAAEGIIITDAAGRILEVNRAFCAITGYGPEELIGNTPDMLKSDKHGPDFYREMRDALRQDGHWSGEIWDRRKNGEAFPSRLNIFAYRDGEGKVTRHIGVYQDLSELHRSRNLLQHEVNHDGLTGLPNRFLFHDRLSLALSRAREKRRILSVVMIGLDRFGAVNKTLGYPVGDGLLQEAGKRLAGAAAEPGAVARFGGDEFVVLLTGGGTYSSCLRTVERMLAALRNTFSVGDHSCRITASAGVTFFPRDGESPEELLQNASLSMERAKREGGNTWRLFTEDLDRKVQHRMRLEADLRRGFDAGEFHLFYQPRISLEERKTVGLEALLRWTSGDGTMIPPDAFIPLAEEIGEIRALGAFALEKVCLQWVEWSARGMEIPVAVNLSAKQISSQSFVRDVLETVDRTGMNPYLLQFEITESAFMEDPDHAQEVMAELGAKGIRFSLDDFGTGFSSLSKLRMLPISELKIDRSFILDMESEKTRGVVSTMIHLAGSLGMELTFEGVETREQLEKLRSLIPGGMSASIQGYLFSRPLPPERIPQFLASELPDVF